MCEVGDACENGVEKAFGGTEGRWMCADDWWVVMVFWSDMEGYRSVCDQIRVGSTSLQDREPYRS